MVAGAEEAREMLLIIQFTSKPRTWGLPFPWLLKNYSSPAFHLTCTSVAEATKM